MCGGWGIPEGCRRLDGNPRAGCPCGGKRRALGRLRRAGSVSPSAASPGNFQTLLGRGRRATGSGPRLSARVLRAGEEGLQRLCGRPRGLGPGLDAGTVGRGAAPARPGGVVGPGGEGFPPLWAGRAALLRESAEKPGARRRGRSISGDGGSGTPVTLAGFSPTARTARPGGHIFGLRAVTCPDRGCSSTLSKCLTFLFHLPAFFFFFCTILCRFLFTARFLQHRVAAAAPFSSPPTPPLNPQCDFRCLEATETALSEVTRDTIPTLPLFFLLNSAVLSRAFMSIVIHFPSLKANMF